MSRASQTSCHRTGINVTWLLEPLISCLREDRKGPACLLPPRPSSAAPCAHLPPLGPDRARGGEPGVAQRRAQQPPPGLCSQAQGPQSQHPASDATMSSRMPMTVIPYLSMQMKQ